MLDWMVEHAMKFFAQETFVAGDDAISVVLHTDLTERDRDKLRSVVDSLVETPVADLIDHLDIHVIESDGLHGAFMGRAWGYKSIYISKVRLLRGSEDLRDTLYHEVIHLLQMRFTDIPDIIDTKKARLRESLESDFVGEEGKSAVLQGNIEVQELSDADIIEFARSLLSYFTTLLLLEGTAMIAEELLDTKREQDKIDGFDVEVKALHAQAATAASILNDEVESVLQRSSFSFFVENVHREYPHEIGKHMAYVVISETDIDIRGLMDMKPQRFIIEYEACMEERDRQPVVSYASGNGVFDYKEAVEHLSDIHEPSEPPTLLEQATSLLSS